MSILDIFRGNKTKTAKVNKCASNNIQQAKDDKPWYEDIPENARLEDFYAA